jgi:DNA-binding response OmpR family regulator
VTVQVLVVDDDPLQCKLVEFLLQDEGYDVATATNAESALAFIEKNHVDVFILDVVMPRGDGFELCRTLRESNSDVVILFLTGRVSFEDRVSGLNVGADDYLIKPFEPSELVARVRALSRRYQRQQQTPQTSELRVGNVGLHVGELEVVINSHRGVQRVGLTPTEAKLLRCLMVNADRVVPKETLLDSIWGAGGSSSDTQAVAVYIRRLRKKLETHPDKPSVIELVWGSGYRFSSGSIAAD